MTRVTLEGADQVILWKDQIEHDTNKNLSGWEGGLPRSILAIGKLHD
jgi:hypothetical protein